MHGMVSPLRLNAQSCQAIPLQATMSRLASVADLLYILNFLVRVVCTRWFMVQDSGLSWLPIFGQSAAVNTIVGHHLATKVFIGKLPATRGVWVITGYNRPIGQWWEGAIGQQTCYKTLIGVHEMHCNYNQSPDNGGIKKENQVDSTKCL
jgi:hypothetical protein